MSAVIQQNKPFITIKPNTYNMVQVRLSSKDDDDNDSCHLTISGLGKYITINLPEIVKPRATKVIYTLDVMERVGSSYYWKYDRCEYGFSIMEDHFSVFWGVQADDSSVDKRWGCFIPWKDRKFLRRTIYNSDGSFYANFPVTSRKSGTLGDPNWNAEYEASQTVAKDTFKFLDFDGEALEASCFIEEREWSHGTSWCSWLKYFKKNIIRRDMDIAFSGETGKRKGSWKGGTLGHGINMLDDKEGCESAFKRYCLENNMKYVWQKHSIHS